MTKPKLKEAADALGPALEDLKRLQAEYDHAENAERTARNATTAAVNRLNDKQKEVDALIADLRNAGSGGWAAKRRQGVCEASQ